ncbi:class I SAM-dependent methyltransferase [Mucisphaera calidilacus]|uniref:Ubiquinone biosynthesis O-methyltransferase n=1 Tax=Mucisphaera calidilacus TaxID=2527982 RepID=A0A518BUX8_9BACT|nr:class I SAM-dependent methyltransferase [Mucisphaera calidilacus]QDU70793.1 Ubiquinone biosynthesis O-methyltransferase [Mucisphaera calidilacus]
MTQAQTFESVPIDRVRRFWNDRPCNLRHSPEPVGTRAYFEQVARRKYHVEPHIPRFAQFDRWKGKRVLEVGCGIGTDTISFASAGAHVTAVDLSEASLNLTRQRAEIFGVRDRVRTVHANAEELDQVIDVEPYDLIYSFGVIHHTPHPDTALRALHRFAGPDTQLKLMVYYRYAWKVMAIVLTEGYGRFWKLNELVARSSEAQSGCPVTYTYTRRTAAEWLERCGFEPTAMAVDHVFPYRIADYKEYRYVRSWHFRWMPNLLFRGLERTMGWHLCIDGRAGATS